jgi:hypothetical protein
MTNVSSFEGLASVFLVALCTCVHLVRIKSLKPITDLWIGPLSLFRKAAVLGLRLKVAIGALCLALAFFILFIKH